MVQAHFPLKFLGLRVTHDCCSGSMGDIPRSCLDTAEVVVAGKWLPGDDSLPPLLDRKSSLQTVSRSPPVRPALARFPPPWHEPTSFPSEVGQSPICVSLHRRFSPGI